MCIRDSADSAAQQLNQATANQTQAAQNQALYGTAQNQQTAQATAQQAQLTDQLSGLGGITATQQGLGQYDVSMLGNQINAMTQMGQISQQHAQTLKDALARQKKGTAMAGTSAMEAMSNFMAAAYGNPAYTSTEPTPDPSSTQTALGAAPADTDEFLVSDAGTIKRVDYSYIKAANTPAFSARESGQQTISHNTVTNLTFGTEEIDTDSAFASNIFTVPSGQGGKYYLECQINLYDADSNISACQLWLWKGSNSTKLSGLYDTTGGGENRSHVNNSVSVIADLSATDTVGAAVNMTTTDGGTATSYGGDSGTRIIGFKLAGA